MYPIRAWHNLEAGGEILSFILENNTEIVYVSYENDFTAQGSEAGQRQMGVP